MLLTTEHSLIYMQNECFDFCFETYIKVAHQVLRFLSLSNYTLLSRSIHDMWM